MRQEKSNFFLERKIFAKSRNLAIISILFFLLLFMMQIDIIRYKSDVSVLKASSKIEESKAKHFRKWPSYGVHGVLLVAVPSHLNFLTAFKIWGNLYSQIDSEIGLKIYDSRKDGNVLPDTSSGYLNFSGLILLFGFLLALLFGNSAFKNEREKKLLCIVMPYRHVFWKSILSKMFFVSLSILFLILLTIILAFINGINIINPHYFYFAFIVILVSNFYIAAGAFFGTLKKRKFGLIVIIGFFLSLNFLVPWMIIKISSNYDDSISEHKVEADKLEILMSFENRGIAKFRDVRKGEDVRVFIKGFFGNELKLIEGIETRHKETNFKNQRTFQELCCVFPSSFFLGNVLEISGQGFKSYQAIYKFAENQKRKFIELYANKKYLSENAPEKVQSFVKDDSNIYYCKPSLPPIGITLTGIILTLLYTAVFLFFAYLNAYNKIFPKTKTIEDEEDVYIPIERGKITIFFTTCPILKNKIFNHLVGKEKIKGEIELFPEEDFENQSQIDIAYISPGQMNDIPPDALHQFLLGKKPPKSMDHWDVLFEYALTKKIAVFDEFQKSKPDKLQELVLKLKEHNVACLIISSDYFFTEHFVDENTRFEYYANEPLAETLKKLKDWLKEQKEQKEKSK